MTEDQQGGTTPEPEATASDDQVSEQSVAAVAVADEPATITEAVEDTASTDAPEEAPAAVAEAPAPEEAPAAVADDPVADEPVAEASGRRCRRGRSSSRR